MCRQPWSGSGLNILMLTAAQKDVSIPYISIPDALPLTTESNEVSKTLQYNPQTSLSLIFSFDANDRPEAETEKNNLERIAHRARHQIRIESSNWRILYNEVVAEEGAGGMYGVIYGIVIVAIGPFRGELAR